MSMQQWWHDTDKGKREVLVGKNYTLLVVDE
jgi:hypothetical protein